MCATNLYSSGLHYSMSDSEIPRCQTRSSKNVAKESARDSTDSDSSLSALVSTVSPSSTVEAQQKGSATRQMAGQTSVLDQLIGETLGVGGTALGKGRREGTECRSVERTHKEEEAKAAEKQQADRLDEKEVGLGSGDAPTE